MTEPERDAIGRLKRPKKYSIRIPGLISPETADRLAKMAQATHSTPSRLAREAVERELAEWAEAGGQARL